MKRISLFFLLIAGLSDRGSASVLINEFLYDAPGSDTGKEWVELYNTDASTVALEGWTLEVDSGKFPGTEKASLCGTIPPHGFYLIKEVPETISTSAAANLVSGTLALPNATSKSDGIQLVMPDGDVSDRVVYGPRDTEGLCGEVCTTAPVALAGFSLARSTPGSAVFVAVSSKQVSPTAGPGICGQGSCPAGSGDIKGWISEVSPSISNGDFIELFIAEPTDLCGAKIFENDDLIKQFPSVTPKAGSYLLIHASRRTDAANPDETDKAGDLNADRVTDLYSDESSPGLTGSSSGNLTLKNSSGVIVDFLSWRTNSGYGYSAEKQKFYDEAVSSGAWSPPCAPGDGACHESWSVAWADRATLSMLRRLNSRGEPLQILPSSSASWFLGPPSPGRGMGGAVSSLNRLLAVRQSPFSPLGDGKNSEAVIEYRTAENESVTLQIFDVAGRRVRTLLENEVSNTAEPQIVFWDGRDDASQIVPIGIYVVHIRTQGGSEDEQTVIVGRRL